jgi:hypothetical protein
VFDMLEEDFRMILEEGAPIARPSVWVMVVSLCLRFQANAGPLEQAKTFPSTQFPINQYHTSI